MLQANNTLALKAGDNLIPLANVVDIDIEHIERGFVTIFANGRAYTAYGFDAIEAIMMIKPSALEGRRLKWNKNAWAYHNFIAHPIVQILAWLGLKKQAVWYHDYTTPMPRDFKNLS